MKILKILIVIAAALTAYLVGMMSRRSDTQAPKTVFVTEVQSPTVTQRPVTSLIDRMHSTPTPSIKVAALPVATKTPIITATLTPTPMPKKTATPTPTPEPTKTATPSPTPTATPTGTPTPTASPTPPPVGEIRCEVSANQPSARINCLNTFDKTKTLKTIDFWQASDGQPKTVKILGPDGAVLFDGILAQGEKKTLTLNTKLEPETWTLLFTYQIAEGIGSVGIGSWTW